MSEKQLKFNVEFKLMPETMESPFNQHFLGYIDEGLVKSEPGGTVMPTPYKKGAEKIYNFQPRKDDTWIVTFAKCGTTWTQEMVWLIVNNCDFEGAKKPLGQRSPFLEYTYMETERLKTPQSSLTLEKINKMPSPRVIKSHMPFYLLHPDLLDTCKTIYVARNPKDAMVSYYHHHKLIKFHDYKGSLEEFAQYFMDGKVLGAPFFGHILEAWAKRDHPNMLFLFYEDMKKDLRGQIEKVAKFLDKKLTEEQINQLREHLRFDNFQKNESVNNEAAKKVGAFHNDGRFIRNGKTGDWKNHFNPELNRRIDEWIAQNLAGTDLKFITELDKQD